MSTLSPILQIFTTAVKKVTNSMVRDYNEITYMQSTKSDGVISAEHNFAVKAFQFIENKIYEDIKKFKPDYSFILGSGNTFNNKDDSNTVIINSICGFNNFKRSIPMFAVSVALLRDKKAFAGVVYNPLNGDMFAAEKGKGATFNQKRLKNSEPNAMQESLIAINSPVLPNNISFNSASFTLSNCVALDLCYLAANKIDLCLYNAPISYTEAIAGIVIAEEAGFKLHVSNSDNNTINKLTAGSINVLEKFKL